MGTFDWRRVYLVTLWRVLIILGLHCLHMPHPPSPQKNGFAAQKWLTQTHTDIKKKCREEIASTLNDFGDRLYKRAYVEPRASKAWKVSVSKIVDNFIFSFTKYLSFTP